MAVMREAPPIASSPELPGYYDAANILRPTAQNKWELHLPAQLQPYQGELEALLSRVFGDRPASDHDLKLAKQLALNWCTFTCRKLDITVE